MTHRMPPTAYEQAIQSLKQSPRTWLVTGVADFIGSNLSRLFSLLRNSLAAHGVSARTLPTHRDFRSGDVRHSQADMTKAQRLPGFVPTH